MVLDREVYGAEQFSRMHEQGIWFVTWDKNVSPLEMAPLDEDLFSIELSQNDKTYRAFEGSKIFTVTSEGGTEHRLTLRRISLWNKTSNCKTCGLSNVPDDKMSIKDCALVVTQIRCGCVWAP